MQHEYESTDSQSELIGSGQGAKVFLEIGNDGQKLAKKVFEPKTSAKLGYGPFRWREHPYDTPYTSVANVVLL